MRISDWSSDVCSSDLHIHVEDLRLQRLAARERQELSGQGGAAQAGLERDLRHLSGLAVLAESFAQQVEVADDTGQQIVEDVCQPAGELTDGLPPRSEEHTSELQSLMRR